MQEAVVNAVDGCEIVVGHASNFPVHALLIVQDGMGPDVCGSEFAVCQAQCLLELRADIAAARSRL